jgi:VIT1/CCC1 family predicted Fe2+/Mn2+ transporter
VFVGGAVTAWPGNQAAAGRGRIRASHADREQVTELLKAAFVQGRLTMDELDVRLGQVFASRTYAELAAVTADIPVDLVRAQPLSAPERTTGARPPMNNAAKAAICLLIAAVTLVVSYFFAPYAFGVFVPFYLMALLVAGAQILHSRRDKRSRARRATRAPGGP